MQVREADPQSIYVRIVEDLRSLILSGELAAENHAPSTKELSGFYQVNLTTVAKAMTELLMVGFVERKRRLSMSVTPGAYECIQAERRKAFQRTHIELLKAKAGVLGLTLDDIIVMLEEGE